MPGTVASHQGGVPGPDRPRDWTGDGNPEGWKVIDRAFTQAEARYIPNGPNSTSDMAHPTRTGDLVVFAYPPYQFDAATPGTLIAKSEFFGQHGYVPDVQDLRNNINMRATFLAGGDRDPEGRFEVRSIDIAPTVAYLLGVPEPQQSQGKVLLKVLKDGSRVKPLTIIGLNDFHGQLDPTTMAMDGLNVSVGGAGQLATMFDEDAKNLPGPALLLGRRRQRRAPHRRTRRCWRMPRPSMWRTPGGWTRRHTATTSSTTGSTRLQTQQKRAKFPFLATNIVDGGHR